MRACNRPSRPAPLRIFFRLFRLDPCQITAAALDAQNLDLVTEEIGDDGLHRRIAATVQYQRRITPYEARGVDTERDIFTMTPGILRTESVSFMIGPEALHDGGTIARFTPQDRSVYVSRPFKSSPRLR